MEQSVRDVTENQTLKLVEFVPKIDMLHVELFILFLIVDCRFKHDAK